MTDKAACLVLNRRDATIHVATWLEDLLDLNAIESYVWVGYATVRFEFGGQTLEIQVRAPTGRGNTDSPVPWGPDHPDYDEMGQ